MRIPARHLIGITVAGLFSCGSASHAQVYSANVVGYVNIVFNRGTNLFANPLNRRWAPNTVATLLANRLPDGTFVYKQVNGNVEASTYSASTGWDNPTLSLLPGEGAFLVITGLVDTTTVTFIGEVPQGHLSNPLPQGYSLRSSKVPQPGRLQTDLKFPALDGDVVLLLNVSVQQFERYAFEFGEWYPPEPTLDVGQAFVLSNHLAAMSWERVFYPAYPGSMLKLAGGSLPITIPLDAPLLSPLRVSKNGTTYGIPLVATNAPSASPVRVMTTTGVKALGSIPELTITFDGPNLRLEWSGGGRLQTATGVLGPWSDVPGATSPLYFAVAPAQMQLFLVRQ